MITTDLFPNASSFYVGQTANQYTCYLSGDLYNLTIPDVSVFDGYYLGWCTPETLPSSVLQTSYYVDTTNNKLKFFQSTPDENFKIGYGQRGESAVGNVARVRTSINDGASPSTHFYNVQYNYLYNNLYPEYVSGLHSVILTFVYYSPSFNGASESGGTFQKSFGIEYTYTDFYSFIYDDMPLTAVFRLNNIEHTITFKYSDLKDKFFESFIADTGREFIVYSSSISWRGHEIYNGGYSSNDSYYESLVIYNSCVNEYVSDATHTFDSKNVIIANAIGGQFAFWNGNARTLSLSIDYVIAQPPTCDIDFTELGTSGDYVIFRQNEYGNGGVAFVRTGALERNIYFVAPLKYFINAAMLMWRVQINQTYSYQLGGSWATDVKENDQFLGQWKTGNIANTTFKNGLRPWQYSNIQDNEFEPDDAPPYTPPSPEPGDDQGSNTGSILRPTTLGVGGTNGFITQYSLTASQIAEIGRLLWLSFTDPDYYKNFLFTLTTTGTLNLSNLLDYFVSLRVYPFPLINVPSHAAAGQDMWIGAGLVPLSFNTNLHTINNYADYIDAGSCTIPRYYNDFRDFAHTQIMLYLPYCGTVQLNPADVVGSTLHAQYAVDFATGGVTAYVDCTTWDGSQFVIAVLTGSIGADIPLTASNAAQIAARIAGDALNFAGTVGEAISSDVGRSAQAIGSAATGDVVGAAIGVANTYAGRIGGALDVAQTGLQIATAEGVKMPMLSGGRGFGSFGAPQTAYVQIRRGIYAEGQQPPQGFKEAYGEAYSKPVQVSSCTGFTVFANVDTSGLQCDAMEREQVKKMMQAGIYI